LTAPKVYSEHALVVSVLLLIRMRGSRNAGQSSDGSSIIFQVYRVNLGAKTVKELQGEKLAEIEADGGFVSGSDTVAAVKAKVRPLLEEEARLAHQRGPQPGFHIEQADHITLLLNGRPTQDDTLFYADKFIVLPVWVQVLLHGCEFGEVVELAAELRNHGQG
jgi:hypothetical protein